MDEFAETVSCNNMSFRLDLYMLPFVKFLAFEQLVLTKIGSLAFPARKLKKKTEKVMMHVDLEKPICKFFSQLYSMSDFILFFLFV